ncbi:PA0069 family radical SAM protein [Sphingomonas sp. LY54]|uniref:PA0069 family radical SAM protein n=1 Tax=Sphingomonas sp. LY54 TaxID=3095343 RepID=UPI002D76595B|nr:PA0069 family radical SAM protein [Sphingomonas sp. LY54]WRP28740.1 PA0069 family radical SAM protein [Sphingomonas sp. LY54]
MKGARGRGATENHLSSRFDDTIRISDGDWLDGQEAVDGAQSQTRTEVTPEVAKSAITFNRSPDIPFDRSINAFRGCEHGCIYCFARPTHAYHNLSPGLDFETKLFVKENVAEVLRDELARPSYHVSPIALGTNTDPYQPIERRYELTRRILEVLSDHDHPVTITTKSAAVTRDLDILGPMAAKNLVTVVLSITTLDAALARKLEPRASAPAKRIEAIGKLADSGVQTHVGVSPVIPGITDHEIERIIEAAAAAGATGAFSLMVRLPHEVSPLFRAWLAKHYPERLQKVMHLINDSRGGRDNDPNFFSRMSPTGPYAELLRSRFLLACKRSGLVHDRMRLRTDLFQRPSAAQLRLL